jgi:AcrR family transcriptional regulator
MAKSAPTASASRAPLTRERVLRSALELADAHGIEAVSMRRLGQQLGVEAMSLYNHVANKDDILNGMVELAESDIELPPVGAGTDWKAALRATAMSAHDVFEAHPWAANLTLSGTGARPVRWRYMNALLGCLREAGFSAEMTDLAYHALESHIAGFTLWAAQLQVDPEEMPDLGAAFIRQLPPGEFPWLIEHVEQHLKARDPDAPGAFAFGLDLILDGLERALAHR